MIWSICVNKMSASDQMICCLGLASSKREDSTTALACRPLARGKKLYSVFVHGHFLSLPSATLDFTVLAVISSSLYTELETSARHVGEVINFFQLKCIYSQRLKPRLHIHDFLYD